MASTGDEPAAQAKPPAAADPPAPAAADPPPAPVSSASKNRIKKLKAQYLSILDIERRMASGQTGTLDEQQREKVARKAAVAEELASLGAELPEPPPLPPAPQRQPGGGPGDISQEDMMAALDALALGGAPARSAPPGASLMLRRQMDLLAANPGADYFFTLPEPFPDMGVTLHNPIGKMFFLTMRPKAEAGQPRAVKMLYEQLQPSAESCGFPLLQLRQQLIHEYKVDPVTEQPVLGSMDDQLEWLEEQTTEGERQAAQRQMERLVSQMAAQGGTGVLAGGGGGGGGGRRQQRRR